MLGFFTYFLIFFVPLVSLVVYMENKHSTGDIIQGTWVVFLMSLLLSIISILVVSGLDPADDVGTKESKTPIYSMYNSDDIHGEFFLLAGTIDEDHYYTYLKMNKHGNYVKERIEENYDGSVEIKTYEGDAGKPVVIRYWDYEYNEGFWTIDYECEDLKRTVIQIPEGSLKREIQIK